MSKELIFTILGIILFVSNCFSKQEMISLPQPTKTGRLSLEEALTTRRSIRQYSPKALTLNEVSSILWAGYGKNKWERKTSPSAGALYPIFLYIVVGKVENLEKGIYLYNSDRHTLTKVSQEDTRSQLALAALSQSWLSQAPLVIAICARFEITTSKYGKRGIRYVYMEAGYVSQNIYLEATSLGLGTVTVGAFYDEEVKKILNIDQEPLLLMPIGNPR